MFVSVVIPALNDAAMLARCLTSLAQQRRVPDEIVVVDNGSTDDTRAVAEAAGARVIWEPIRGIPRASAAGYDAARGELIARIDADSVCPPEWLERAIAAFDADPDLAVISGSGEFYDAGPLKRRLGKSWWVGGLYWSMTIYLGHAPIFGSNFAMRRAVWNELAPEVHREEVDIHDDLDLSLHIKPWMAVRYDPDLVVGISARPFDTWTGFTRRLSWIIPTLRNHWPDDSPWARRSARRRFAEQRDHVA
ncbi:glycosyltransferase family 2 protein [Pseudolysinimonas yzui]|uniref:Glycosyl transferase family A n=1 Tax=Pseudolysinimonas yzui TaxID=2708254 RepID=A0A8J3LZW9_9MICO|nr:glycosyltransferase family 2 protein [Pseudolysinimonas yzui]GHF11614.1 glycosyl transferase family A [Pseudolysinimonas yzui]